MKQLELDNACEQLQNDLDCFLDGIDTQLGKGTFEKICQIVVDRFAILKDANEMVPCVTVIMDNVIIENILCDDSKQAEKVFKDKLAERLSNWDEYTAEDVEAILDNGYETFGNGSVCLSWATKPE